MYLVAFSVAYILFRKECRDGLLGGMSSDDSLNCFLYAIVGLILGARVGSCLLYEGSAYYLLHPWMMFWPFRNGQFIGLPGMSFHGGLVGAVVGTVLYAKKYRYKFLDLADCIVIAVPLGYTFGRLGNFINGELWGRCTGTAYGMVFPDAPVFSTTIDWVREAADAASISYSEGAFVNLPRHPSQLYEALGEGILLFFIMWFAVRPFIMKKKAGRGFGLGAYLIGYGTIRFIIEYFREPDSQLGFIIALGKETEPTALFKSLLNISMGQILCLVMVVAGVFFMVKSFKLEPTEYGKKKRGGKKK